MDQSITVTSGTALTLTDTDVGAVAGPSLVLFRDSASPAASDVLTFIPFQGRDSAGNNQEYARILCSILDPTSTSEDGELLLTATTGGSVGSNQMRISAGIQIGSPTGGYKGSGTINVAGGIYDNGTDIGSIYQPLDAGLTAIAALAVTNSNIIVGDGATWVAESGATARTSLGVGTGDSPQFTAVNIGAATDTTISRVSAGVIQVEANTLYMENGTDVAIADGGTGQSSAAAGARALLNGIGSTLGNMLYYNGSNWVVLAKPTQSSVLTMDSSGIPAWVVP